MLSCKPLLGSLWQAMPIDEVTNRANTLIAEWQAGDAKAVGKLQGLLGAVAPQVPVEAASKKPVLPSGANQMADFRHLLGCDGSKTLVAFAVNNLVGLAIVNMGAHRMVMCPNYVREFGLRITPGANGNCGCFAVPGSGIIHNYVGVIE